MRNILVPILFLIPMITFADTIKCFSGNRTVYYRNVSNITYTGEVFIFEENTSGKTVMYSGECIVKFD